MSRHEGGTAGVSEDTKPVVMDVQVLRPAAVVALGYTGRVAAVEACMPLLADGKLAKLAGEAMSAITGREIDGEYLKKPGPGTPEEPKPLEE